MLQRPGANFAALGTAVALGACVMCMLAPSATTASAQEMANAAETPLLPACIDYVATARSRNLGYDHVVRIRSECATSALCVVATSVDPKPVEVRVSPRSEVEVVTRIGSPAREFVAAVSCSLP